MPIRIPASIFAALFAVSLSAVASPPAASVKSRDGADRARATALAAVPGGIVQSEELEHERGLLVWSFDIKAPGSTAVTEILVDSVTGKIISKKLETPAEQAKEASADHAAARGTVR